jgi:GAF domain-containing protein
VTDRRPLTAYDVIEAPPLRLDALVELAALVLGVPCAVVNVFTADSQHQVSASGFQGSVTPREEAVCRHVVETGTPILVEDASWDERFAGTPMGFYGSHPLRTSEGAVIGTLCVFDHRPRPVTAEAGQRLARLADSIVSVLELELATRGAGEADERLARFAGRVRHDLKNPLTSISLSLESLEMEVTDDHQAQTLARARRGVDRMNALLDDLREIAARAPGDDG